MQAMPYGNILGGWVPSTCMCIMPRAHLAYLADANWEKLMFCALQTKLIKADISSQAMYVLRAEVLGLDNMITVLAWRSASMCLRQTMEDSQ